MTSPKQKYLPNQELQALPTETTCTGIGRHKPIFTALLVGDPTSGKREKKRSGRSGLKASRSSTSIIYITEDKRNRLCGYRSPPTCLQLQAEKTRELHFSSFLYSAEAYRGTGCSETEAKPCISLTISPVSSR